MAKISNIIIGVVLVSILATFFTVFIYNTATGYDLTVDNQTRDDLQQFQKHQEQLDQIQAVKESVVNSNQGRDFTDILGGLFQGGYSALLITKDSFSTVQGVSTAGIKHLRMDSTMTNVIIVGIEGIITIILVFIIISTVTRREQ